MDFPLRPDGQVNDFPSIVELLVPALHLIAAPEGGAVGMKPVADHSRDIALDFGIGIDAHGGEDPESLALEVLEDWPGLLHVIAVRTRAMGVVEDWRSPHQFAHLGQPFFGIFLDHVQGFFRQIDMPPGMAPEGPAGAFQFLDNRLDGFPLLLTVLLMGRGLVFLFSLCPVAQNPTVTRQAQTALGAKG